MDDSKLLPKLPIAFCRANHRDVYSAEEMHDYARAAIAAATPQPAAERDKVDALVAAAESVIACVVGDLPTKGWLHDTDMSRKALSNLRAAILAKKEGA